MGMQRHCDVSLRIGRHVTDYKFYGAAASAKRHARVLFNAIEGKA